MESPLQPLQEDLVSLSGRNVVLCCCKECEGQMVEGLVYGPEDALWAMGGADRRSAYRGAEP